MLKRYILLFGFFLLFTGACGIAPGLFGSVTETPAPIQEPTGEEFINVSEQNYPLAQVYFRVAIPGNTPPDQSVYLNILDEVTGLALNVEQYEMEKLDQTDEENRRLYEVNLPTTAGSSLKYRYTRQAEAIMVAEHTSSGEPVRYRIVQVDGPTYVEDIVSRWTDTEYQGPSGRIVGRVTDAVSGQPIEDLLILIGGFQTRSDPEGAFQIDGLPVGLHNLVGYAMDGAYQTFYQGAVIAPDLPTLTPIALVPRSSVEVNFLVKLPENTPPVVPVRIAGNLTQLGNTFETLLGGMSVDVSNMPSLQLHDDGLYRLSLSLPSGTDLRYKYTLGDGFWNAEHQNNGEFRLRQLIIPEQDTIVSNIVDSWSTETGQSITFDVTVPTNTPDGDFVSIQLNPIFGWTEPIPMWELSENRWAYVLFSPLNLPGNLSYRYCRNNLCGTADDINTPGEFGAGKPIDLNILPNIYSDQVDAWTDLGN